MRRQAINENGTIGRNAQLVLTSFKQIWDHCTDQQKRHFDPFFAFGYKEYQYMVQQIQGLSQYWKSKREPDVPDVHGSKEFGSWLWAIYMDGPVYPKDWTIVGAVMGLTADEFEYVQSNMKAYAQTANESEKTYTLTESQIIELVNKVRTRLDD